MPRSCTICGHAERESVDLALVRGTSYRTIADQHGVSKTALIRHKADHLPVALVKSREAAVVADADTLLHEVRGLQERTLSILACAEEAGELSTALRAIREARGNLELLGKLAGELNEAPTVNVLVASAEWMQTRATILNALDPYPPARLAVSEALSRASGG